MTLIRKFKDVLASWATGVCVVTTKADGLLYGLTVSSFSSLSLDPPLVLVCVANSNVMCRMVERSQQFAVSVLTEEQTHASGYFAISGREPTPDFVEVPGAWTDRGLPVVADAMAYLECDLEQTLVAGDHTIVIGRVVDAMAREGSEPLLYFRRSYRTLERLPVEG